MPKMSPNLMRLVKRLVSHAYPEFSQTSIGIDYGRISSYANVRWSRRGDIQVTCSVDVREWPEPAILGLIAHELSHPAQDHDWHSEMKTDQHVLSRGLGPYLAVERILTGKYHDHTLRGGKDRYLGYSSIRSSLNTQETSSLNRLLEDFRLVPSKSVRKNLDILHDIIAFNERRATTIMVEGKLMLLPPVPIDADIKILVRENHVFIYADEEEIGQFLLDKDQ